MYDEYLKFLENITSPVEEFIYGINSEIKSNIRFNPKALHDHLCGRVRVGARPDVDKIMQKPQKALFGSIDIDLKTEVVNGVLKEDDRFRMAVSMKNYLKVRYNLSAFVEVSRSGAAHVWVFFKTPRDRKSVQKILEATIHEVCSFKIANGSIEIFPKGEKGTAIFLPFYNVFSSPNIINMETVKSCTTMLVNDSREILSNWYELYCQSLSQNDSAMDYWEKFSPLPPCFTNAAANWTLGNRDAYTCGLASISKTMLNLTLDDTKDILGTIINSNDDSEHDSRMSVIEHTYRVERPAGCSILQGKADTITVKNTICSESCPFFSKPGVKPKIQDKSKAEDRESQVSTFEYAGEVAELFTFLSEQDNGFIWMYDDRHGIWHPNGESFLMHFLETSDILPIRKRTTNMINNIIGNIRRQTLIKAKMADFSNTRESFPFADPNLIPFKDCVYDMKTHSTLVYKPEFHLTCKLPWNFNPHASSPNLDKIMAGFVEPDFLVDLYEMLGFSLWRDNTDNPLWFFIKGEGSNGKSLFMHLWTRMLGESSVSSVSITDLLEKQFAKSDLIGKMLNDSGEVPMNFILQDTDNLKRLSSGDSTQMDVKFKSPVTYKNYAKMVFCCNHLPRAKDQSDGFFRRLFIINFNRKYKNSASSSNLMMTLTASDFEALAFKSLQHLIAMKKRNMKFTHQPDPAEVRDFYLKEGDLLGQFITANCEIDMRDDSVIIKSEFKDKFMQWLGKRGVHHNYSDQKLGSIMKNQLELEETRPQVTNERGDLVRPYAWQGIRWKEVSSGPTVYKKPSIASMTLSESLTDDRVDIGGL